MSQIFLSYRRSDSLDATKRLYDMLEIAFGKGNVFRDIDSLPIGSDFPTVLTSVLSKCQIVLVIIGPGWLTAAEDDGTKRLYTPRDFVRQEVESALAGPNMLVVPVLIGGGVLPDVAQLPESLRPLCRRNKVEIRDDPNFNGDVDRLVEKLRKPPTEWPAQLVSVNRADEADDVVGRDRAFPNLAERAATTGRVIVLVGPAGIGKTTTAAQFGRWRACQVVWVDARREFHELSIVEAVGEAYPLDLYKDHGGEKFLATSFRNQRRLAANVLVHQKAILVLDAVGEAIYPRDPAEEVKLAQREAREFAAAGVLVLVTTCDERSWAGCHPITLQGLSETHAEALLKREVRAVDRDHLTTRVGGTTALQRLVNCGHPGDLIAAGRHARGEEISTPTPKSDRGVIGTVIWVASAIFGDPTRPPPPSGSKTTGFQSLLVVCIVLMLTSTGSVIAAYESGSPMWQRMFFELPVLEHEVPPLSEETTSWSGPVPGLLVEIARAGLVIMGLLLVVTGQFFWPEAAALVPYAPWVWVGPRRLGPRSAFRLVFLGLFTWLGVVVVDYHLHKAPRVLWMCNGNPFLQDPLALNDRAKIREFQNLTKDERNFMNSEPPRFGEPRYEAYRQRCLRPYWFYLVYSVILFVVVGSIVLTVCFSAVCMSLYTHVVIQSERLAELGEKVDPHAIENRLRYYQRTYLTDIDRYLILLLMLLIGWSYHLWWDQYNLTRSAQGYTTRIIVVALTAWATLFAGLILTYQPLIREVAKSVMEERQDEFARRHAFGTFFVRGVIRSSYFWLTLAVAATGGLFYIRADMAGWAR